MQGIWRDLGYSIRVLRRSPGFAAGAILTIGIGIGAATALFSVVRAVLLNPLPFPAPEQLIVLGQPREDATPGNVGYATYVDWRERATSLDDIAAMRSWVPTLIDPSGAERLVGVRVTWNYFRMLGAQPALGRDFRFEEDTPDQWHVVILSDRLWRRRFGADPTVLGRSLLMNGERYQVVGIMPPTFQPLVSEQFYWPAEIWAPIGYDVSEPFACRSCQHLRAVGRMAPGVTVGQALADLENVQGALKTEYPSEYADGRMAVMPLDTALVRTVRPALLALLGAAALLLIIGCANVANLVLARATDRHREVVLRTVLGAGPGRLARQILTENVVIGIAGGALGILLAFWGIEALLALSPTSAPRVELARLDPTVAGLAFLVSFGAAVLFGLPAAWRASRTDLQTILKAGGTRTTRTPRARAALVIADVALTVVLLTGAGLMVRSVLGLLRVDPGFDPHGVLTLNLSFVGPAYRQDPQVYATTTEILERVQALPGVEAAAVTGQVPLGGSYDTWGFHIEGRTLANPADAPSVERYSVTPDYFRVMRIPLRRGRLFTPADDRDASPVMLVGETTARRLWPGEDPIGARVRLGGGTNGEWRTIVGIVGDVRHYSLASPPTMQMYLPQSQVTDSYIVLAVRSATPPADLTGAIRRQVAAVAGDVPTYDVATLDDLVGRSVAQRRFVLILLAAFGVMALVVTIVGLYAVVSFAVTRRAREVSVRVALGARPLDIARVVIGQGMALVGVGTALGLIAAYATSGWLASVLFEVSPVDPLTLGAVVALLVAIALAAHVVPVRRATRIDPAIALQAE